MSWYKTQLKKPQWQKKRLEIMNRDEWKCNMCDYTEEELHVHHNSYKGHPWEADNDSLDTLCKHCHSVIELTNKDIDFEYHTFLSAKRLNRYLILYVSLTDVFVFSFKNEEPFFEGSFKRYNILF